MLCIQIHGLEGRKHEIFLELSKCTLLCTFLQKEKELKYPKGLNEITSNT
jgi:hypothetical protein